MAKLTSNVIFNSVNIIYTFTEVQKLTGQDVIIL